MLVVSPTVHRGVTSNLISPSHLTEFLTNNYYSNFTPMEFEAPYYCGYRTS